MVVVAVPGGLGDFGQLIVNALLATGKHEVYSITRKVFAQWLSQSIDLQSSSTDPNRQAPKESLSRKNPEGTEYCPIIETDYQDESALAQLLEDYRIHTIISALNVDWESVSQAQVRLITAAAATKCVKRFIPSEYNVDYDLPDDILPYPEKRFHVAARRALEQTHLEYTYIYPGMFMDYLGMPRINTHLRPIYVVLDLENRQIDILGDGSAKMALTHTVDAARYIAATLDLPKWPRELTTSASHMPLNDLAKLAQQVYPVDLQIRYLSIDSLRQHSAPILQGNIPNAAHFDGGMNQLQALLCDLGAAIALGAYDFSKLQDAVDLVELLGDKVQKPVPVEKFLRETWGARPA